MSWLDEIVNDDRWTEAVALPETRERATKALFDAYVNETPERQMYVFQLSLEEQRALQREFNERMAARHGERYNAPVVQASRDPAWREQMTQQLQESPTSPFEQSAPAVTQPTVNANTPHFSTRLEAEAYRDPPTASEPIMPMPNVLEGMLPSDLRERMANTPDTMLTQGQPREPGPLRHVAGVSARALAELPAGMLDGVALASKHLDDLLGGIDPQVAGRDVDELYTARLAEAIRDIAAEQFPTAPSLQNSFLMTTLPGAVGSFATYIGGGAATKVLKGSPLAFSLLAASSGGSSHSYREAKAMGASEDDARLAADWGLIPGAIQVFPVMRALDRFDRSSGGAIKAGWREYLRQGGRGAFEEWLVESFGQIGTNKIAMEIYDNDRRYLDGVLEAGAAGSVAGFLASFVLSAAGGRVGARRLRQIAEQNNIAIDESSTPDQMANTIFEELQSRVLQGPLLLEAASQGRADTPAARPEPQPRQPSPPISRPGAALITPPPAERGTPPAAVQAPAADAPAAGPDGQYGVYPLQMRGRGEMYAVSLPENAAKQGFGDPLYSTREEALREAQVQRDRQEANARTRQAAAAAEQEQAARVAEREQALQGYLSTLGPMEAGKARSVLGKNVSSKVNDQVVSGTRYEVVEQMLEMGLQPRVYEVRAIQDLPRRQWNRMEQREQDAFTKKQQAASYKSEYGLEYPDGSYKPVTKAEYDYARYLAGDRIAPELPAPPAPGAGSWEAVTPQGDVKVSGSYRVVDAAELVTSDRPEYDQALQPRDRSTAASREQIAAIAQKPDPLRLGDSPQTDGGAPLVVERNQVLSGNGRVMGLRQAYANNRAAEYRQYVEQRAQELGLSTEGMQAPVLVRQVENAGGESLPRLAELSNRPSVLQRSEAEIAEADAKILLDTDIMDLWAPDAVGTIRAASNRPFLREFVRATGDQSLLTSSGDFHPSIDGRVQRAVLGALIGRDENSRAILRDAIEKREELGVLRTLDGVMSAGGRLLRLARMNPDYDLIPFMGSAFREFMAYRRDVINGTIKSFDDFAKQGDLFSERVPEVDILLRELANRKTIKAVRAFFEEYVRLAEKIDVSTGDMFGQANTPLIELLRRSSHAGQESASQGDLFSRPAQEDRSQPTQQPGQPPTQSRPSDQTQVGGTSAQASAPSAGGGDGGLGTPHAARVQEQTPRFMIEAPEMVQLVRMIMDGKVPKIVQRINIMHGAAAGVFRARGDQMDIELRADIFNLVQPHERAALQAQAEAYAKDQHQSGKIGRDQVEQVARDRYEQLIEDLRNERLMQTRDLPAKVLAHEIGHLVDYLPDHTLKRGNLFGRIATLKDYLKHTMPRDPNAPHGEALTAKDRAKLRRDAQKQLTAELGSIEEIVRTILVEEPDFRIVGIRPQDVRNLMGIDAREMNPDLYRWFAGQSRAVKSEILKKAMRDQVDERLTQFAGREQVGTRKVEKTIREKRGREPTKEEIKQRYKELLKAEIARRNLAEQKVVRDELMALTNWWTGDMGEPGSDYYKYRSSGKELYAEAISVLINNPVEMAVRAPTFYEMLFNYLGSKPKVQKVYEQIQDDIRSGNVQRERVQRLRENFQRGNERAIEARELAAKMLPGELKDWFSFYFDRTLGPIYRRNEQQSNPVAQDRLLEAMEDFKYHESQFELYLRHVTFNALGPIERAGMDWMDLAEFVYHQRVINERADIANPDGWDPVHSQQRLDEMRGWGPDKFRALEEGAAGLRRSWEENVLQPLRESGAFDDAFMDKLDENIYYATFAPSRPLVDVGGKPVQADTLEAALAQKFGDRITAGIRQQIGFLGDIRDPVSATILKGRKLIQFAYRNKLALETVDMLRNNEDPVFGPARMRWVERGGRGYREPVQEKNLRVGTLVYMKKGQLQAHYVPRVIAEAFERGESPVSYVARYVFTGTALVKGLFTSFNPGFWSWSLVWDSQGFVHHMPGARFFGSKGYFKYAGRAAKAAINLQAGRPDPIADEALRNRDLIARGYYHGVRMIGTPSDGERLLISYGLKPPAYTENTLHKIKSFVEYYIRKLSAPSQIQERIPKIAGRMYLDEHFETVPERVQGKRRRIAMGAGQKKETIHQMAGSPDYLSKGASAQWMDVFFRLFFNPMKESFRSKLRVFKDRRVEAGLKFSLYTAPWAVLVYMMEEGLLHEQLAKWLGPDDAEEIQKMLRAIPEHEKTNYRVFPLGWYDRDQQKVIYLRVPFEPNERALHAALRAALTHGEGGQGIAQFYGDALPGDNPFLKVGLGWWDFAIRRKNPYDAFFRRPVLTEDQMDAGMREGVGPMLKWTSNQFFGTLIGSFDLHPRSLAEPPPEGWERFLRAPVVRGTLGRWVRISNRGLDDVALQSVQEVRQHHAHLRLVGWEMVSREMSGQEYSPSQRELLASEPYLAQWLYTKGRELGRLHLVNPEIRAALSNARSIQERYIIMQRLDNLTQ